VCARTEARRHGANDDDDHHTSEYGEHRGAGGVRGSSSPRGARVCASVCASVRATTTKRVRAADRTRRAPSRGARVRVCAGRVVWTTVLDKYATS
jgi:hypothetical protein